MLSDPFGASQRGRLLALPTNIKLALCVSQAQTLQLTLTKIKAEQLQKQLMLHKYISSLLTLRAK